jgi:hypothetical protein
MSNHPSNGEGALQGFWAATYCLDIEIDGEDDLNRLLSYFDEKVIALSPSTSLLHPEWWDTSPCESYERGQISLIRRLIEFLKAEGYEFDRENQKDGKTYLLEHLANSGGISLEVVRLLIEFGANIHETDNQGCNALQCAMLSRIAWNELPRLLEEKLSILIGLGVDIHHRDS